MIEFYDFVPKVMDKGGFLKAAKLEELRDVMEDVNFWVKANNIDVINIETVVLPNIHQEEGSQDTNLHTSGEMRSNWYQFVRVWYRR